MNSYLKRVSLVAAAVTLIALVAVPGVLRADDWDLKTYITVNVPFQVPGQVLEPNTKYVFKRMDSAATRNIVQVFNADQSKLLTQFMAISDYRLEPTDKTVLTFMETAPGYAKPVRSWFYPGRLNGLEFIYSGAQKQEIAAHMGNQPAEVQTAAVTPSESNMAPAATAPANPEPAPPATSAQPEYQQNETTLNKSENTNVERMKPSEMAPPESAAPQEKTSAASNTLPKTAGELPLIGLLGLACLGARFALRRV